LNKRILCLLLSADKEGQAVKNFQILKHLKAYYFNAYWLLFINITIIHVE
jgi:hypothetical protein